MCRLVDICLFCGFFSIHPRYWLTDSYILHEYTDQRMIKITQKSIILSDHTKILWAGSVHLAPINTGLHQHIHHSYDISINVLDECGFVKGKDSERILQDRWVE